MNSQKNTDTKSIYLCTFGTDDLKKDKNRFLNQALSLNIFKKIFIYGVDDLDKKTREIIKLESLNKNKEKGYNHGYFIWKSHIVKKSLSKIPKNSYLFYIDLGCVLNLNGKSTLYKYINDCNKFNCIGFQYRESNKKILKKNIKFQKYLEFNYTKKDVFNYFNVNKNHKIYKSEVIWAGSFLLKKNKITVNFISDWVRASKIELLKPENKSSKNVELIQSSLDQSIFSILFKKYNFKSLCASEEVEWIMKYDKHNKPKKTFDHLSTKPIQARRLITKKLNLIMKLKSWIFMKLRSLRI